MNMKNILRLMGAFALTTGAATSVVACNDRSTPNVGMDGAVSKQLGLTSDDVGTVGTQAVTLDATTLATTVTWTIPALTTQIDASKLLATPTSDSKAANQDCYNFITGTLKIKPKTGTSFADGEFDHTKLAKITGKVTNIKPTLTATADKKDYSVSGGTFNFQFNDGTTNLGDNYTVNLKIDAIVGVIVSGLTSVVTALTIPDTDVVSNTNILFVKDGAIPTKAVKGAVINITGTTTDPVKQFKALNDLTGLNIAAQFESTDASRTWVTGKTLTISYKTADVNFDATTVKTILTVPA